MAVIYYSILTSIEGVVADSATTILLLIEGIPFLDAYTISPNKVYYTSPFSIGFLISFHLFSMSLTICLSLLKKCLLMVLIVFPSLLIMLLSIGLVARFAVLNKTFFMGFIICLIILSNSFFVGCAPFSSSCVSMLSMGFTVLLPVSSNPLFARRLFLRVFLGYSTIHARNLPFLASRLG